MLAYIFDGGQKRNNQRVVHVHGPCNVVCVHALRCELATQLKTG